MRDTILSTAAGLFAASGYEAIGVSRICSDCGISKPTLYYHFGSKEGLLSAIFSYSAQEFRQAVDETIAYKGDINGDIPRLFRIIFTYFNSEPIHFQLVMDSLFSNPDSSVYSISKVLRDSVLNSLTGFFLAAAAEHHNIKGKEAMLALSSISSLAGLCRSEHPDEAGSLALARIFMHGMFS